MKVVEALYEYGADVVGLLKDTDDEVVFMNDWLFHRDMVRPSVRLFKVYTFEAGKHEPMALATLQYVVTYGANYIGKVVV